MSRRSPGHTLSRDPDIGSFLAPIVLNCGSPDILCAGHESVAAILTCATGMSFQGGGVAATWRLLTYLLLQCFRGWHAGVSKNQEHLVWTRSQNRTPHSIDNHTMGDKQMMMAGWSCSRDTSATWNREALKC